MLTRACFSLILAMLSLATFARGDVFLTEEQALKLAFPQADKVEKELLALTADERAAIEKKLGSKDAPRIFKYWVGRKHNDVLGYVVIDDVLGKDQPITYMVSVNEKLVVRSVEIMAYREARGGEIRQADWREQFRGTSSESRLRVGSDIRNIAGATISCRSLTDGVRRQLACLSVLVKLSKSPGGEETALGAQQPAPEDAPAERVNSSREEAMPSDAAHGSHGEAVSPDNAHRSRAEAVSADADHASRGDAVTAHDSRGDVGTARASRSDVATAGTANTSRVDVRSMDIARGTVVSAELVHASPDMSAAADAARASRAVLVSRKQLLMGTTLEIRAYVEDGELGQAALEPAFAEVARLEGILSTWREDSEVSRLNLAAGGAARMASPELLELCELSIQKSERTLGTFDVSVGPLIELWKAAVHTGASPTVGELEAARQLTGYAGIELDRERGTLRLARPGMGLDFGGIGKGYALDHAARKLEEHGIHSALLDFGGQLLALDPPPQSTAWSAEVRDPAQPERALLRIQLARASISSTADYERGMLLGNRLVSHIVDPRTGLPVEGMLGVSVITATAVEADALSTTLYVLGFDAAERFAKEHDLRACVVAADGRTLRTKGFRSLEVDDEKPR